jgi:hypothetical protein
MENFKTHLAGAVVLAAVAGPQGALADPTFEFYGQLNFGLFNVDDGTNSETFFTDNDNSNTRIGLWYENALSSGDVVKFNFETGLGIEGSSALKMGDVSPDIDLDRTELRKLELIYESASWGRLSFGQGSTASDGVAEADFSGTSVIAYSGIADLAGSFEFRPEDGPVSGIAIGDAFKSFDGSRRFRLRYDTPAWNNLVFSISGGEEVLASGNDNEYYDIGAKYAGDYGDLKVEGRLGYSWVSGGTDVVAGSVAGLHVPTGLSLAISAGAQDDGGNDSYIYAKLGYQRDILALGRSYFSIDYNDGSDYAIDGSDSKSWALAAVQKIDAYDLEIYAVYRNHAFDASGRDYEDIDVFALGARWKF